MTRAQARRAACVQTIAAIAFSASSAGAFEFFDDRLSIHGFYEMQTRSLVRDFEPGDDWDLAQWYHVLNLEIESDLFPDGLGPFDLISMFARVEVRYDCVWTHGCAIFPSADAYGDRARNGNLPKRVSDGRRPGTTGQLISGDFRQYTGIVSNPKERPRLGLEWVRGPGPKFINGTHTASDLANAPGFTGLFGVEGVDQISGRPTEEEWDSQTGASPGEFARLSAAFPDSFPHLDDPADVVFEDLTGKRCRYGFQSLKGSDLGNGTRILPWDPACKVQPNALNADAPNPLRGERTFFGGNGIDDDGDGLVDEPDEPLAFHAPSAELPTVVNALPFVGGGFTQRSLQGGDFNDRSLKRFFARGRGGNIVAEQVGFVGFGEMPLRRAPVVPYDSEAPAWIPRGVWLPSPALANKLRRGDFKSFDQNFRQAELEWNRGASQQDEKELKELYFDLELFDSRLWLRLGKQQIVWGKTELFRTTDQFNPQDLGLASLPSLEESRIALWAVRGVYSFYEIGPFEDVRLELAANIDQFEPVDLGRCGEPFSPLPTCDKTFGLQAHGLTGAGLAGEVRPEDPWNNTSGLEIGGRLEWRWDRFSFAMVDFWGYNDFPTATQLYRYGRNVDPTTGRPRRGMSSGRCSGSVFSNRTRPVGPSANLAQADNLIPAGAAVEDDCLTPENALTQHSINQTLFHLICGSAIGFTDFDPSVCAQSVFNSTNDPLNKVPVGDIAGLDNSQTIAALLSNILAGNDFAVNNVFSVFGGLEGTLRIVKLNADPCDGFLSVTSDFGGLGRGCDPAAGTGVMASLPAPGAPADTGGVNQPHAVYRTSDLTMNQLLTSEQKALLGCGEFYGTNCEIDGIDLMNAEASVLTQAWIGAVGSGFDGTESDLPIDEQGVTATVIARGQHPGTVGFVDTPIGTRFENGRLQVLPGARGPGANLLDPSDDDPGYDPAIDGCVGPGPVGCNAGDPVATGGPADPNGDGMRDADANLITIPNLSGDPNARVRNELAAVSKNLETFLVGLTSGADPGEELQINEFDPDGGNATRLDGCSYERPYLCSNIAAIYAISGVQRNVVRAGGNGRYGRRDFAWAGGQELYLRYEKRNVFGISMDVAEDVTKTNWSVEFTWIEDLPFSNNNDFDGITKADTYNLTVSVDRPTFINFLNANRTFFMNSQWFFQYTDGYEHGFTGNGAWNVLATFTMFTGYFQDRLTPSITVVYDLQSSSAAVLTSFSYRFTESFSATWGFLAFSGHEQGRPGPLTPVLPGEQVGGTAYRSFVSNGLSVVRERDELYLRIKYTF